MLVAQCWIFYVRKITVPGMYQLAACHSTIRTCWLMVMRLVAWFPVEHVPERSSLHEIAFLCASGRLNSVPLCTVGWRVQVAPPCRQDTYRLASCEVQTQIHNKCSSKWQLSITYKRISQCNSFRNFCVDPSRFASYKQFMWDLQAQRTGAC
jgi:hypothetical protein